MYPIPFKGRATCKLTRPQREAHATEELVAREPIVVPDGQLETPLGQLRQRDVLVDEGVVPDGRVGPLHDRRFLLRAAVLVRQKVAAWGKACF